MMRSQSRHKATPTVRYRCSSSTVNGEDSETRHNTRPLLPLLPLHQRIGPDPSSVQSVVKKIQGFDFSASNSSTKRPQYHCMRGRWKGPFQVLPSNGWRCGRRDGRSRTTRRARGRRRRGATTRGSPSVPGGVLRVAGELEGQQGRDLASLCSHQNFISAQYFLDRLAVQVHEVEQAAMLRVPTPPPHAVKDAEPELEHARVAVPHLGLVEDKQAHSMAWPG